jgi:hypothetical protein
MLHREPQRGTLYTSRSALIAEEKDSLIFYLKEILHTGLITDENLLELGDAIVFP